MLEVKKLFKKYKGSLDYSIMDITFNVGNGKVVGLLGKNGAGKSTTIKSICGIFPFDKGNIILDGFDIKKKPIECKQLIGYSPDDHSIYEKLTGYECLDLLGSLHDVPKSKKLKVINTYAKILDIEYALNRQISSYSHGMKQKICVIASLIHEPKLWILDEPMLGLDPQTKLVLQNLIKNYAKKGNSVLFSSHDIYTVNKICDYIAIINKGKIVDWIDMKKTKYNTAEKLEKHFFKLTGTN